MSRRWTSPELDAGAAFCGALTGVAVVWGGLAIVAALAARRLVHR